MSKKYVLIDFSLFNLNTNSLISGTTKIAGSSFSEVADKVKKNLTKYIPRFLKANHPAEDPASWELFSFQDYESYSARFTRADEYYPKTPTLTIHAGESDNV